MSPCGSAPYNHFPMATAAPPTDAVPAIPWRLKVRRQLELVGTRGLAWRVRHMSRPAALQLADRLAGLALKMPFLRRNFRNATAQIADVLANQPEGAHPDLILQESMRTLARTMVDFLRFPLYSADDIRAQAAAAVGGEYWNNYLASDQGAMIGLGMHIGSWEWAGAHVVTEVPMAAAGKAQRDSRLTALAIDLREGIGIDHFLSQENSRKLIETLRRRDKVILGLIADQNGGRDGVFVPVAGRLASCVKGPGFLMQRYKVPAMLLTAVWDGDQYRPVYGPPFTSFDSGNAELDGLLNTARIHEHYHAMIRAYPGQWLWLHRRFKSTVDLVPPEEWSSRVLTEEQWAPWRAQCPELEGLTERLRGA